MKQFFIYLIPVLLLVSCSKEAGEGGRASIKGTVNTHVRLVLSNPTTFQSSYPTADQEVFIVYGDNVSPDDRIHTNFDGEFEFQFLRPGNYTIYTYSKDSTGQSGVDHDRMAIIQEVEISDRKQTVDAGSFIIYDTE